VVTSDKGGFFLIKTFNKSYYVKCKSEQERFEWLSELQISGAKVTANPPPKGSFIGSTIYNDEGPTITNRSSAASSMVRSNSSNAVRNSGRSQAQDKSEANTLKTSGNSVMEVEPKPASPTVSAKQTDEKKGYFPSQNEPKKQLAVAKITNVSSNRASVSITITKDWECRRDPVGVVYYFNRNLGKSTYKDPVPTGYPGVSKPRNRAEQTLSLPAEWEMRRDPFGKPYYFNQNRKISTYAVPIGMMLQT